MNVLNHRLRFIGIVLQTREKKQRILTALARIETGLWVLIYFQNGTGSSLFISWLSQQYCKRDIQALMILLVVKWQQIKPPMERTGKNKRTGDWGQNYIGVEEKEIRKKYYVLIILKIIQNHDVEGSFKRRNFHPT